jgi:hypothetical protein
MHEIAFNKSANVLSEDIIENEVGGNVKKVNRRKCRYYNRGFCKHKIKCRYVHPDKICKKYLEKQTCEDKQCSDRHPKLCKWLKRTGGCKRQDFDYLHCGKAQEENERKSLNEVTEYKCQS